MRQRLVLLWGADIETARGNVRWTRHMVLWRPIHILAHIQIGQAVAIEVSPCSTGGPNRILQARFGCNIFEFPTVVAVESEAGISGNQKVGPAIRIVIGCCCPMAIKTTASYACRVRDVSKFPPAHVAVELVGKACNSKGFTRGESAAAHHKNVQQAIAIIIQKCNPTTQRF